jgi:hypothetical protein
MLPLPLQFLAACLALWLGRDLQQQVDKLNLTDADRRRLAVLAKELGHKLPAKGATIADRCQSRGRRW